VTPIASLRGPIFTIRSNLCRWRSARRSTCCSTRD
jgi:hypothetical protein